MILKVNKRKKHKKNIYCLPCSHYLIQNGFNIHQSKYLDCEGGKLPDNQPSLSRWYGSCRKSNQAVQYHVSTTQLGGNPIQNLVLKKTILVLNSLIVHYFNLDQTFAMLGLNWDNKHTVKLFKTNFLKNNFVYRIASWMRHIEIEKVVWYDKKGR